MHMDLPKQVKWIIEQLNANGYEAFAVGGCVRDMLLNKEPMDWDLTTNAKPWQVKEVFLKTVDTGIEHGTVTVIKNGRGYEVTTYRVDGEYEDSRHPKEVTFTTDIRDDLCRRDFTINAMAYNETKGFVDCFGGIDDLNAKLIRCVGNPEERFTEDALRILRAYRFSSQLEFDIEPETVRAAEKLAKNIENVSVERIALELIKLLTGKRPEIIRDVFDMKIMERFLPECEHVSDMTVRYLNETLPVKEQRLAALLIGQSENTAKKFLRNLKLDNETIKTVSILIRHIDDEIYPDKLAIRRMLFSYGEKQFSEILSLMEAKAKAYENETDLKALYETKRSLKEIIEAGECVSLKDLALNGKDLIEMGREPGKAIGEALSMMMEEVLCDPAKNTKEYLVSLLDKNKK